MTISRHPEPCTDPHPGQGESGLRDGPFTPRTTGGVTHRRREELGPCSLDPAALFGARLPSVFETRRRLPTSATDNDVRATKPGLLILAGTEASTSFLF
jgi:hypothetical protein